MKAFSKIDEYTKLQAPRYFTSGSPNICGNNWPPMSVVGPVGNRPPSTNVAPPSSEYMNPETERAGNEKPRKSLNPITTCCPVLSTAMEVSACKLAETSGASPQSGSFTQRPEVASRPLLMARPLFVLTASTLCFASRPMDDKALSEVTGGF